MRENSYNIGSTWFSYDLLNNYSFRGMELYYRTGLPATGNSITVCVNSAGNIAGMLKTGQNDTDSRFPIKDLFLNKKNSTSGLLVAISAVYNLESLSCKWWITFKSSFCSHRQWVSLDWGIFAIGGIVWIAHMHRLFHHKIFSLILILQNPTCAPKYRKLYFNNSWLVVNFKSCQAPTFI